MRICVIEQRVHIKISIRLPLEQMSNKGTTLTSKEEFAHFAVITSVIGLRESSDKPSCKKLYLKINSE